MINMSAIFFTWCVHVSPAKLQSAEEAPYVCPNPTTPIQIHIHTQTTHTCRVSTTALPRALLATSARNQATATPGGGQATYCVSKHEW